MKKVKGNVYAATSDKLDLLIPVEFSTSTNGKVAKKDVLTITSNIQVDNKFNELLYYYLVLNDSLAIGPRKVSTEMFEIKFMEKISTIQVKVFADEGLSMIAGDTLYTRKYFLTQDFTNLKIKAVIDANSFKYRVFVKDTLLLRGNKLIMNTFKGVNPFFKTKSHSQ